MIQIATFWWDDALARTVMLPSVGTYLVYAGRMPDDLLELVGICQAYAEKRCIKHPQLAKFKIFK